jgi:transcriptional regulator with XRE-family HTH domain
MAQTGGAPTARIIEADIRRMRERGLSVREIARRSGLGKSFVHDVTRGKRQISAQRAAIVSERLSRVVGTMRVIVDGQVLIVEPLHQRDFSKIGRYWNVLEKTRRLGNYDQLKRELTKAQRTIKTTEGTLVLETDPIVLRELDDAGMLTPQEILIGESA